jgi:hypothetical protein
MATSRVFSAVGREIRLCCATEFLRYENNISLISFPTVIKDPYLLSYIHLTRENNTDSDVPVVKSKPATMEGTSTKSIHKSG